MEEWMKELTDHVAAVGVELSKKELYHATPLFVVAESNVKRRGTQAWTRFEGYFSEGIVSIGDAFSAGLRQDDIRHDSEHGFILLGDAANAAFDRVEADRMIDWTLVH